MQDTTSIPTSPAARLAQSRAALFRQMLPHSANAHAHTNHDLSHGPSPEAVNHSSHQVDNGTWQFVKLAKFAKFGLAGWWQHHPLHAALHIARPYLGDYARNKPLQLIGLAAGLGALAVMTKPWRLVSITGLAALAVKSTDLPSTVLAFINRSAGSNSPTATPPPSKDLR